MFGGYLYDGHAFKTRQKSRSHWPCTALATETVRAVLPKMQAGLLAAVTGGGHRQIPSPTPFFLFSLANNFFLNAFSLNTLPGLWWSSRRGAASGPRFWFFLFCCSSCTALSQMNSLGSQEHPWSLIKMGNSSRGHKTSGLFTKCRVLLNPQFLQTRPEFFPCFSEYTGAETRVCHQVLSKFSVHVALTSAYCGVLVNCQGLLARSPTEHCHLLGKKQHLMEFQAVPLCEAVQPWCVEQARLFAVSPPLSQMAGYGSCRSRSLALAFLSPHSQQTLKFLSPHTSPTCLSHQEDNPQITLNN